MSEAVSPAVRSVLDLYAAELAPVKFPDLDADILRAAAALATQRAEEMAQAESALEKARTGVVEAQDALLLKAHRALAYAKVFAEEDPALTAKIEAIALPRTPRRQLLRGFEPLAPVGASPPAEATSAPIAGGAAPRRRGRPPKAAISTSAPLFGPITETDATAAATAAAES